MLREVSTSRSSTHTLSAAAAAAAAAPVREGGVLNSRSLPGSHLCYITLHSNSIFSFSLYTRTRTHTHTHTRTCMHIYCQAPIYVALQCSPSTTLLHYAALQLYYTTTAMNSIIASQLATDLKRCLHATVRSVCGLELECESHLKLPACARTTYLYLMARPPAGNAT